MRAERPFSAPRLSWIALLLVLPWATVRADADEAMTWWVTNPLTKVRPQDPAPQAPEKRALVYAGRNEFEPFQLVLRGGDTDLPDIDIELSDLHANGVADIPKANVTVYFEQFVNLTAPSSDEGGTGLWPDPLIPRIDAYTHEKRNAFPFTLLHGRTQPLWIEIFVPTNTISGSYSGSVRVSSNGAFRFAVPVTLTVWSFALPSTSSLRSSFGLSGVTALKQHKGQYTSDDDLYALTRLYEKAALLHRITTYGGSGVPPTYRYSAGRMQIDWSRYDSEVGPFLDGSVIPEGEPLQGAKATSVDLRTPTFANDDEQSSWWKEWVKHFDAKGWRDRLFLYLWDEPAAKDYSKVLQRGRAALEASPSIRNLVTVPFTPALQQVVRIWVPLVNCLEAKPGFDPFCEQSPPFDAYAREVAQGKSLWFYQSCASHGCNVTGGSYFAGWPSYMIDMQGPANRVMQWVAWKYGIQGELYYSMNESYAHEGDPWTNVRLFGGNGDGTLFYPGRPRQIGGQTDIPIESIRLKLIREGMEDYEYLDLLAKLAGKKTAEAYADRIVQKPYAWENRPAMFLRVRQEMGDALNRLAVSGTGRNIDAQ